MRPKRFMVKAVKTDKNVVPRIKAIIAFLRRLGRWKLCGSEPGDGVASSSSSSASGLYLSRNPSHELPEVDFGNRNACILLD